MITHFFLDVPAKGKDAKPVQASRKVSEGAVEVTIWNGNGLHWEVYVPKSFIWEIAVIAEKSHF